MFKKRCQGKIKVNVYVKCTGKFTKKKPSVKFMDLFTIRIQYEYELTIRLKPFCRLSFSLTKTLLDYLHNSGERHTGICRHQKHVSFD